MGDTPPPHTDSPSRHPARPTTAQPIHGRSDRHRHRRRIVPWVGWALLVTIAGVLIAVTSTPEPVGGLAPPADRSAHGAAGTARNGHGGEIAPSSTGRSWPGAGPDGNGGPVAFVGAQYGPLWNLPTAANNSRGVGYCVMEDVPGEGRVGRRPDPAEWSTAEMANAAALMSTFGGDRVVPYGIDAPTGGTVGAYDVASGEWQHPLLWGGGEYTRRRHVAVNFGVRMFLEDLSPSGAARGLKLARDTAVVDGTGGEFSALRNGYRMAQRMASVAEVQAAVGGVTMELKWQTPDGVAPTRPGRYGLQVHVRDGSGRAVGWVPVLQLSSTGIDGKRSIAATARARSTGASSSPARVRYDAAVAAGWPTWNMGKRLVTDPRFSVGDQPAAATVADRHGVARFEVEISAAAWEIGVHTQAPTAHVDLYAGTGIQGQVTWTGRPQSASAGAAFTPPPTVPPTPSTTTPTTTTSTTTTPAATSSTTTPVTSTTTTSASTAPTTLTPATPPPTPTTATSTTTTPTTATSTTAAASPTSPSTTPATVTPTAPPTAPTIAPTTSSPSTRVDAPDELPRTGGGAARIAWWAAVVLLTGIGVLLNIVRPDADHPM